MTNAESVKSYRLQPLYLQLIMIVCSIIKMVNPFQWVLVQVAVVASVVVPVAAHQEIRYAMHPMR